MVSLFCKNCEFVFSTYENTVYQNVELIRGMAEDEIRSLPPEGDLTELWGCSERRKGDGWIRTGCCC